VLTFCLASLSLPAFVTLNSRIRCIRIAKGHLPAVETMIEITTQLEKAIFERAPHKVCKKKPLFSPSHADFIRNLINGKLNMD
jgi:hypothetical protein